MTAWRWTLLISELFLFALILVLPQVDLPDTTFRDGTAPVVARMQLTAPPAMPASASSHSIQCLQKLQEFAHRTERLAYGLTSADRRSLLCTLLC
jgi:hypothetical protein